jgi:hypothetical protein
VNFLRACALLFDLGGPSWVNWRALLGGALGCPLDAQGADVFRLLTKREPLKAPARELWLAIGRRGGKNRVSAACIVYLALLKKWTLAPGETPTVLVLASDRVQAKVAFRYILGLLRSHPSLAREIVNVTADTIMLLNGVEIAIGTADNAAVRGRTIVACICDEFAFWAHEEAAEVLRALRPGMATQPDSMLIVISSVFAAYGPFYEARRAHFGVDDSRVLYAVATSQQMNPTLDDAFIAAELARDPAANSAEYLSIERSDRAGFADVALVDGNTRASVRELPRVQGVSYVGALDVSGGRDDATAAAIAFRDGDRAIIAACRRWSSPHDASVVASQVAEFLKGYGLTSAVADDYGAGLSTAVYRPAGLTLTKAENNASDTYLRLLPLLTSNRIEMPPDPILRHELLGLERHVRSSGKDFVTHRDGAHDDLANAVARAAVAVVNPTSNYTVLRHIRDPDNTRPWASRQHYQIGRWY